MKVLSKKVHCLAAVFVGLVIAGAAMASAMASAQDVYKVNYFDNNFAAAPKGATVAVPAPDAKVRIDNPGLTYGNLCAMIYVFAADQQLAECCGCIQTHNGLTKLSVRRDLTSNPLTGVVPISGVIKVVSATPHSGVCDPTMGVTPKANLRVWVTHIQDAAPLGSFPGVVYPTTETESSDSTLGATELANLQSQCAFVNILGSGAGICTCTGEVIE